jgi:hypothetical protein
VDLEPRHVPCGPDRRVEVGGVRLTGGALSGGPHDVNGTGTGVRAEGGSGTGRERD